MINTFMFKRLIEWTEIDISRGRKVVMFATVFVYLIIMIAIVLLGFIAPDRITDGLVQIFGIMTGLMATVYGFYTGTSSAKDLYYINKFKNMNRDLEDYDTQESSRKARSINSRKPQNYDDEYEIPRT
nr:MAG TPA: hypothetical protein [Caudoviricetes sp.]